MALNRQKLSRWSNAGGRGGYGGGYFGGYGGIYPTIYPYAPVYPYPIVYDGTVAGQSGNEDNGAFFKNKRRRDSQYSNAGGTFSRPATYSTAFVNPNRSVAIYNGNTAAPNFIVGNGAATLPTIGAPAASYFVPPGYNYTPPASNNTAPAPTSSAPAADTTAPASTSSQPASTTSSPSSGGDSSGGSSTGDSSGSAPAAAPAAGVTAPAQTGTQIISSAPLDSGTQLLINQLAPPQAISVADLQKINLPFYIVVVVSSNPTFPAGVTYQIASFITDASNTVFAVTNQGAKIPAQIIDGVNVRIITAAQAQQIEAQKTAVQLNKAGIESKAGKILGISKPLAIGIGIASVLLITGVSLAYWYKHKHKK